MITKRIYRLSLLARCLVASLFFGKATRAQSGLSAVIVVLTGKLGDIVCCTPVLRALRAHAPHARIIVAGAKVLPALLKDSGLADDYLDLEERGVLARIREHNADAAIVLGPSFTSAALLYLSGIPLVVAPKVEGGYSPSETRLYKMLKKLITTFPYRMGEYAPRERLKALEPLGIFSDDTKKHLGFSETADTTAKQFFADNGIDLKRDFIVGISPSAGNKVKEWPEERFAEVADYLAEKYSAKVIITGSATDKEKIERVIGLLKPETKAVEASSFTIDELKAFISKLKLFISVDTGPIYIAEAFGISTIDITGPIDEREQPPRGLLHRNVVPPHRSHPELFVLNAKEHNRGEALRQVNSITVSAVLHEIDLLIADMKKDETVAQ